MHKTKEMNSDTSQFRTQNDVRMCCNNMDDIDVNNNSNNTAHDEMAVVKLNQLLVQMRTDFPLANGSLSISGRDSGISLTNCSPDESVVPRCGTFPGKRPETDNNKRKVKRKISLPTKLHAKMKEEVVDKLDGLLQRLETIGERASLMMCEEEPQYATINDAEAKPAAEQHIYAKADADQHIYAKADANQHIYAKPDADQHVYAKADNVRLDEPQYSTIDDMHLTTMEEEQRCRSRSEHEVRSSRRFSSDSIDGERYMLDDASRYFDTPSPRTPRHYSTGTAGVKCTPRYSTTFGDLRKFSSEGKINDTHHSSDHATLCRRLRSLEASVGITLKKQLHIFVKKKMESMNVSGCVYCMYAFYENHKKEAAAITHQIRKTLAEQEYLQQTLNEQKVQSDADSLWLNDTQRLSWRDGLHENSSKSGSELYPPVVKAKNLSPLRLRRRIPLWEILKGDRKFTFDQDAPSDTTAPTETAPTETVATETAATETAASETAATEKATTKKAATEAAPTETAPKETAPTETAPTETAATETVATETAATETAATEMTATESATTETMTTENSKTTAATCSDVASPLTSETAQYENKTSSNDVNEISNEDVDRSSITSVESSEKVVLRNKRNRPPQGGDGGNHLRKWKSSDILTTVNTDDVVYQHATDVVKSVIELNTGVQHARPEGFVDLVKLVGLNLRDFLAVVDGDIKEAPPGQHKDVEMAHRVLSADMASLVEKMKVAQKYANTTLDRQHRCSMLQAAHVLAIDAKHLYDTYSKSVK